MLSNYRDELRPVLALAEEQDAAAIANRVAELPWLCSLEESENLITDLTHEFTGLGFLEPYVQQPGVTDVLVDAEGHLWCEDVEGLHQVAGVCFSESVRRALAVKTIAAAGKRLDDVVPFADVQLGRYRFHAMIPPLSPAGTTLSVRIHPQHNYGLNQLAEQWQHAQLWQNVITELVQQRKNFLLTGATGSGKTTVLNAALSLVPSTERIMILEDSPELAPTHPHCVKLQTRVANIEGRGEIPLSDLIRQALRMRPDRLIVGECRGAEIRDFLAAMNTGHSGAGGTIHANSVQAVPARIVAMGALAGMDPATTALQAAHAIDYIIHIRRQPQDTSNPQLGSQLRSQCRQPVALSALGVRGSELVVSELISYSATGLRVHPALVQLSPKLEQWVSEGRQL